MSWASVDAVLAAVCFGYPYVFAWYWMVGGVLYYLLHERREPPYTQPPTLPSYPPVSILVPCYNEQHQAEETFAALDRIVYPDFEIVAVNDGSRDDTADVLNALVARYPRMRVVHLARTP